MRQHASRKRIPAEETRLRLVEAGVDLVVSEGLEIGLSHVTLERALVRANEGCPPSDELSRSSAFYVWSKGSDFSPQTAFQRAVIRKLVVAAGQIEAEYEATIVAANEVLGKAAGLSPQEILAELSRAAGRANVDYIRSSQIWKLTTALHGAALTVPAADVDHELLAWIAEQDRGWRSTMIQDLYVPIQQVLGLTPKSEFGDRIWEMFAASAQGLAEGLVIRLLLDQRLEESVTIRNAKGQATEWGLFAIGFEALVHRYFDFPDWTEPAADPDSAS